jgi:pimeloyl-ACP methyl ester carboxylesterase
VSGVERFEISVGDAVVADLRKRLGAVRWPEQPPELGWELGTDLDAARRVCTHWEGKYDFGRLERLNALGSWRCQGIHFLRAGDSSNQVPVVLLHGWPSGPIEYEIVARRLVEEGREVIVPSLPGYAWSAAPSEPLNVAGMSEQLRALLDKGLGLDRYVVAGGDWGGIIAARMAFDEPERVAGLYVSTPGVLPTPIDLDDPPMSKDEVAFAERAQRWLRREGHHILIQSVAPDSISPALTDSPAGLAAYLIEKYRRWSDSGGDLARRLPPDELCDFLTMFWANGAVAPSMRLYWAERRDRWRLAPGERITVPSAISAFPGDSKGGTPEAASLATLNPPREWSQRVLSDLRRWNRMPSGGHFGAFEEPALYVGDLLAFLDQI